MARGCTLVAVAAISAALMAYEIVLMRRLVVEHWHHFAYLVISMALLGFGVSGTLLAVLARRVQKRPEAVMLWLACGLLAALVVMPRLAALLPVTGRFIPEDLWKQVGWWSLYWAATLVPFLLGAAVVGAALMSAGPTVGRLYAANLFGSAVGAVLAVWFISRLVIEFSLWPALLLALVAAVLLVCRSKRGAAGTVVILAVLALIAEWRWPLRPAYEEYKYGARLTQLASQGSARLVARRADPHGYVELYESRLFHDLPFLALSRPPPPMYSLALNGDPAGSILRIDSAAEAAVMDTTLMAFPYRLIRPRPRVLLIGETGGANVWLARRRAAAQIDVVQPSAALVSLVQQYGGVVLADDYVRVFVEDPRRFLARTPPQQYDLIQIVTLEGLAVGNPGLRGLTEDTLVTVEGFAAGLRALADDGVLAISRGVEEPARANVRLFATLADGLEFLHMGEPGPRLIQVRDYLGVCTLARRWPLDDAGRETLRSAIRDFNLTPVWYAGLPDSEVNRPDQLDGPPGTNFDWLAYADRELLSPRRARFYDAWLLNVRPAHDDEPFFWDFYKPGAITALRKAYGDLWLTRAELGRLFLYASLIAATAVGVLLILVPLVVGATAVPAVRNAQLSPHRPVALATVVYFGGIGLGFMGIEMALISRATAWVGDPIIASALVIGGMLVMSGIGSLVASRVVGRWSWLAPLLVAVVAALLWAGAWRVAAVGKAGALPHWAAIAAALVICWLMGMPLPAGLALLHARAPRLIPWAWGVNGIASVLATSAAIMVAMSAGYRSVVLLAAAAYVLAAIAGLRLGASPSHPGRIIMGEPGAAA